MLQKNKQSQDFATHALNPGIEEIFILLNSYIFIKIFFPRNPLI